MSEGNPGSKAPGASESAPLGVGGRKNDPAAAERLAAALRENLHRRKQQARSRKAAPEAGPEQGEDAPEGSREG